MFPCWFLGESITDGHIFSIFSGASANGFENSHIAHSAIIEDAFSAFGVVKAKARLEAERPAPLSWNGKLCRFLEGSADFWKVPGKFGEVPRRLGIPEAISRYLPGIVLCLVHEGLVLASVMIAKELSLRLKSRIRHWFNVCSSHSFPQHSGSFNH